MRGRMKKSDLSPRRGDEDEALLQQRSAAELDAYILQLTNTVRHAVGAPQRSASPHGGGEAGSTSPPGPFRKQSSPKLQRKKSSVATGETSSPPSSADDNTKELLRLRKENAEMLFLIAAGERALSAKQSAPPLTQSLLAPSSGGGTPTPPPWLQRFVVSTSTTSADSLLRGMSAAAVAALGPTSEQSNSTSTLDEQEAIAVLTNTLREARSHATGTPPPRSIMADLETDIDVKSRAAAPHRRSNEAALKRLVDYVFAPYVDFQSQGDSYNVAGTQTDDIVTPGGGYYTFSPLGLTEGGGISMDLRSALQRDELTQPMVLAAALPFPTTTTTATPTTAPEIVPNRVLLERLLQYHKVGMVTLGEGEGEEFAEASQASSRAGPGAVHLLERFLGTERRPADFREGIAERFLHPDDPLLSAYPCVYLPTAPMMPHDDERLSGRGASRYHHAWIFVCKRSMFLLADVSDSAEQLEQDVIDASASEHWGFRSPPKTAQEIKRKALKRGKKRQDLYEESMAQLKHHTVLLQVAEWDSTLVTIDYSQGSAAFANRTLKDEHPVLLDFGTTPRIDALMALYDTAGTRVDPAELGRQLYASMVLQCHRAPPGKKVETTRYSLVFLSGTDRSEVTSYLWAALHPGRVSGDLFSLARRSNDSMLPACLNMGGPKDTTTTATRPSSSASSKDSSGARIRGLDPMTMLDASQRPTALLESSPFMRYSEPLLRSSHVDWYPMHAVLTMSELEFCRNAHVHPVTLHTIKNDLLRHPASSQWTTLSDIATLLMSHSNAEHPCLASAERVLQLLCGELDEQLGQTSTAACEVVDIIQRLP
ncbi:Hypothetical protein, putative [Bodo saltans]|uniref:Uncharacterized protein n=1 Tax=Bodo saltans TaxID=75058 RepID=A0A0S4IRE9_BODSA|nr:Hypothetical protein, putative [Bodo saltans]|eukprot:CUF05882.1 Hypothetical protein, putative [Bodo saltans]